MYTICRIGQEYRIVLRKIDSTCITTFKKVAKIYNFFTIISCYIAAAIIRKLKYLPGESFL